MSVVCPACWAASTVCFMPFSMLFFTAVWLTIEVGCIIAWRAGRSTLLFTMRSTATMEMTTPHKNAPTTSPAVISGNRTLLLLTMLLVRLVVGGVGDTAGGVDGGGGAGLSNTGGDGGLGEEGGEGGSRGGDGDGAGDGGGLGGWD